MNQTRMVAEVTMKNELSKYIDAADIKTLSSLGYFILENEWEPKELEKDLGSGAIERLLDEIETAEYPRLKEIYSVLKAQNLLK